MRRLWVVLLSLCATNASHAAEYTAYKDWQVGINDHGIAIASTSSQSTPGIFMVTFSPNSECEPKVVLAREIADEGQPVSAPRSVKNALKWRVDKNAIFTGGASVSLKRGSRGLTEFATTTPTRKFLGEMRRGMALRIQARVNDGHVTLRFSLRGFTRTAKHAHAACVTLRNSESDDGFFRDPSEEDEKYFREPDRRRRDAPRDPDAEFFRTSLDETSRRPV